MPEDAGTGGEMVYFSTKQAEEVGFEKFSERQARLQGIHVLVLDHMGIRFHGEDREVITELCSDITDLDLSSNLFESLGEIVELAVLFPKLTHLTLDGNRFSVPDECGDAALQELPGVRSLGLSDTSLSWAEVAEVASIAPSMTTLSAARNGLSQLPSDVLPRSLANIVLSDNNFGSLFDLSGYVLQALSNKTFCMKKPSTCHLQALSILYTDISAACHHVRDSSHSL